MAKKKKRRKARNIPAGKIEVDSKLYGKHLRSKRGILKRAKLNDKFAVNADSTGTINGLAKGFNDEILPYRIKDGTFWSRLGAVIRKNTTQEKTNWLSLKEMEMSSETTLYSVVTTTVNCSVSKQKSKTFTLSVKAKVTGYVKNEIAEECELTVLGVFISNRNRCSVVAEGIKFPWNDEVEETYEWAVPLRTSFVLVILKAELTGKSIGSTRKGMRGMRVVEAVKV